MPTDSNRTRTRAMGRIVPIRLPEPLVRKLDEAATQTQLKRSDVMRMSIERGVDVLLEQLGHPIKS